MRTRFFVFVSLALALLLIGQPSPTSAAPPTGASFGDTLTADTKLTSDLSGSGSGLIVGADGITIDLNGYSLTMTGGSGWGIDNTGGYDNVTVKNGTIEGFNEGVRAIDADGLELRDLEVIGASGSSATTGAIHILGGQDVTIMNSSVTVTAANLGPHAIRLDSVEDVLVNEVDIAGGFIGVSFFSVGGAGDPTTGRVQNCTMDGCYSSAVLLGSTNDAKVLNNEMSGCSVGMQVYFLTNELSGIQISGNYIHDNAGGIATQNITDSSITGNYVQDNTFYGINLNAGTEACRVAGNTITGNGFRGLVLTNGANDNRITDNEVSDNGLEGITLFVGTNTGNVINDNVALGNGNWDLYHNATSTPNTWNDNTYDSAYGADID